MGMMLDENKLKTAKMFNTYKDNMWK